MWSMPSTYQETGASISQYGLQCFVNDAIYINVTLAHTVYSYHASDLPTSTNFSCRANAKSSAGTSPWGNWKNVSTIAGIPPDKPEPPVWRDVAWVNNATAIRLVWDPPISNGLPILRYWLYIDSAWVNVSRKSPSLTRNACCDAV